MRKKNAGALFMDFQISPDDRVGAQPLKRSKAASAPKAKARAAKPSRSTRAEPQLFGATGDFYADDEIVAPQRGRGGNGNSGNKPKRGKAKVTKGRRRERKPLTLGRIFGKLFYWVFIMGIWAGIAGAGLAAYFLLQLPPSNEWAVPDRPANIRIVAANGQLLSNRGKTGGEAVSLRELPYYVSGAVVAIEDRRFYDHFGIDPVGIVAAALDNFRAGSIQRGGSTITQQLAKNLFLTQEQELSRKIQEAALAFWLEQNYSKDDILELYLNRVFFGHGATGIEAAAQVYFGKSARNLSLYEAALLAGSLKAPSAYNLKKDPEGADRRAKTVLRAMVEEKMITQAEADAAPSSAAVSTRTRVTGAESYVADWVESLMTAYLGDVNQDVVVYTTIDWDLQKQAEFVVKEAVANQGPERGFTQGALVAMDVDGTVRALVGGADYTKSQYNRAVTSRRQPGSAFKPFVYLAAMEKGYTPDTVADDSPFTYNGWSPSNASGKYAGPVTLRDALAYSLNTISGRLAIDVGPDAVVEAAQRLGISSKLDAVPSIALGTSEVSLLELTGAYAPFANGGIGVIPNVITRIESADGKQLYEAITAGPGQVIQPEIVGEMNDMLTTALEIGTGKKAALDGWPIAGKTGTSQKARDAVFVGYSARMVTGVWLGNDDDTATKLSGGNVPVQVWSEFMKKAHEGIPVAELPGAFTPAAPLEPALEPVQQQPEKQHKTLVDLLGDIFN